MIRTMQKGNTNEQMAHLQERLGALEASVQHVRAENSDETVETVATRIRNEVLTRVKALEANQAEHGNTVQQMREMAGRTDFNRYRRQAMDQSFVSVLKALQTITARRCSSSNR